MKTSIKASMTLKRLFLPLFLALACLSCRASFAESYVSAPLIALLPEAWQTAQVVSVASHPQEADTTGPIPFTQLLREEWHVSSPGEREAAILLKAEDRLALAVYAKVDDLWRLTAFNERFGDGDCPIPRMSFGGNPPDDLSMYYAYHGKDVSLQFKAFTTIEHPYGFWRLSSCSYSPQMPGPWLLRETWRILFEPFGIHDSDPDYLVALYCDSREPEHGDVMGYKIVLEPMESRSIDVFSLDEFAFYLDKLDRVTIRPPEP